MRGKRSEAGVTGVEYGLIVAAVLAAMILLPMVGQIMSAAASAHCQSAVDPGHRLERATNGSYKAGC